MPTSTQIEFRVVMGSSNPGTPSFGTYAQLYSRFFDVARDFVPPFDVFNDKLADGIDKAGEHGICLVWEPCQITEEDYVQFCHELLTTTDSRRTYTRLDSPPELRTWDQWSWWVYETHIRTTLATPRRPCPSSDEVNLKRRYRKALAQGDYATAAEVVERIRKLFDPEFT